MSVRVNAGSRRGAAGLPWAWWPADCHQRLNVKNPSNGLNGVHRRLALPFDLACWLPLNTSVVVSHWPPPFSNVGSGNGGQRQLRYESLQPGTGYSSSTVKISTFRYFLYRFFFFFYVKYRDRVATAWLTLLQRASDLHDWRMGHLFPNMAASRPTGAQ